MIDTTQFEEACKTMKGVIIDKRYQYLVDCNPQIIKLKELTRRILSGKRVETPLPIRKVYDEIITPFKDMLFTISKTRGNLFVSCMYEDIDELEYPNKVFKYIYTSIHLKLEEKYDINTISCAMLDVMIYCIIHEIEINVMDFINVNWNEMLKKKPISYVEWCETEDKFNKAMSDGYMKDIYLKALEQEIHTSIVEYTYSIVDIAESMRLN